MIVAMTAPTGILVPVTVWPGVSPAVVVTVTVVLPLEVVELMLPLWPVIWP